MYGRVSLGHVTKMPQTNFYSLYPWRLHTTYVLRYVASEESSHAFLCSDILWIYYGLMDNLMMNFISK